MQKSDKIKLLVNFPPSFFSHPLLAAHFRRLKKIAQVRTSSHNAPEELQGDLSWADAVIMWSWPSITAKMFDKAGGLRYLGQINTTGTTARACLEKRVPQSEARHCWSPAVAEMALTLILAGLRKTSDYHLQMRTGKEKWVDVFPADIDPLERELTGRPVGIAGFGAIGQRLAQLLQPFGVELRIFDPFLPAEVARKFGAKQVKVPELVNKSDIVVLCAANTENARHLLGKKEIEALRRDCVLVNVGRSMLVDMKALQERLVKGDMVAMLDVFDKEPLEQNSVLRKLPNAYCTPHRAGGLMSSVQRALTMLTDDLEAVLKKKKQKFAVTEKMLPCFPD
jgi:D-3-phosphoglycerate dehydrogenase / 2-oxoglutarate reductase